MQFHRQGGLEADSVLLLLLFRQTTIFFPHHRKNKADKGHFECSEELFVSGLENTPVKWSFKIPEKQLVYVFDYIVANYIKILGGGDKRFLQLKFTTGSDLCAKTCQVSNPFCTKLRFIVLFWLCGVCAPLCRKQSERIKSVWGSKDKQWKTDWRSCQRVNQQSQ